MKDAFQNPHQYFEGVPVSFRLEKREEGLRGRKVELISESRPELWRKTLTACWDFPIALTILEDLLRRKVDFDQSELEASCRVIIQRKRFDLLAQFSQTQQERINEILIDTFEMVNPNDLLNLARIDAFRGLVTHLLAKWDFRQSGNSVQLIQKLIEDETLASLVPENFSVNIIRTFSNLDFSLQLAISRFLNSQELLEKCLIEVKWDSKTILLADAFLSANSFEDNHRLERIWQMIVNPLLDDLSDFPVAVQLKMVELANDPEISGIILNQVQIQSVSDLEIVLHFFRKNGKNYGDLQGVTTGILQFLHSNPTETRHLSKEHLRYFVDKLPEVSPSQLSLFFQLPAILLISLLEIITEENLLIETINNLDLIGHQEFNILAQTIQSKSLPRSKLATFEKKLFAHFSKLDRDERLKWLQIFPNEMYAEQYFVDFEFPDMARSLPHCSFYHELDKIEAGSHDLQETFERLAGKQSQEGKGVVWRAFLGRISANDCAQLNHILKELPEHYQADLIRYWAYSVYHGKFSTADLKNQLTQIQFTELNASILQAILLSGEKSFEDFKIALNTSFYVSIKSLKSFKPTIENLLKTCDGRKFYKGDIGYDYRGKYVSFGGSFWLEQDSNHPLCPSGFCEGNFWKEEPFFNKDRNEYTQKKYPSFWCRGRICSKPNREADFDLPPHQWTLCEILPAIGIITSNNPQKDIHRIYARYAGWANRMNEILNRLECRACKNLLRPEPFEPKRVGFYAVPLFKCSNQECSQFEEIVRLTHCLNPDCSGENNHIIDSRDCPRCHNNWLVCQDCHACCKEHHDKKIASCPKCGEILSQNRDFWKCQNKSCGHSLGEKSMIILKKFWNKSVDYQNRFIE